MKNIILVGFMGTGKSAVGEGLSKRLKRPFVDMDERLRPVLIAEHTTGDANELPCTKVRDVILAHLFEA